MFTHTNRRRLARLALAAACGLFPALAQQGGIDFRSSVKIDFPPESPITLVAADWGESRTTPRGGALMLDLHTSLSLRNTSQQRIRGVSLLVQSQEVAPGGKAGVTVPSLNVGPAEVFSVRVDLRLLRPLGRGAGPLVEVRLDGVLFDDLSFYGPNQLNSRRSMTVWEMEARRDRRHLRQVLEQRGEEGLREEMLAVLSRQADVAPTGVQLARGGRTTAMDPARTVQLAFVRFPDCPVEPLSGTSSVAGNLASAPVLEVRNRSGRALRHLELGWIIRDVQGRQFFAGTVPASIALAPGQKARIAPDNALRFPQPLAGGMTAYVSQAEFDDGSLWIPARGSLAEARLEALLPPSPEEQRLAEIYRKKGLASLAEEIRRF